MSTVQNTAPQSATPASKPWVARHKLLTIFGLLIVAAVVAFYFLGWPLMKWRFHALFVSSLDEIRKSPVAVQRLGEPISVPVLPFPSGYVSQEGDRGEAKFFFSVVGSKDKAQASSLLRMVNGQWGFTQLVLEFPDKQKLDLATAIQERAGNDTPKFDPNAKPPDVKAPNLPVDITLPDIPGSGQK
ncbi:MAG TPA: cytochrome c oxidase assembly factor Coa1 family protein [Pirellulales bacterium]|jgi:hypothetical protein|nr:cytochrome c oxidase assembly factor Coa1 family protein [Pirellulales bacterium]